LVEYVGNENCVTVAKMAERALTLESLVGNVGVVVISDAATFNVKGLQRRRSAI